MSTTCGWDGVWREFSPDVAATSDAARRHPLKELAEEVEVVLAGDDASAKEAMLRRVLAIAERQAAAIAWLQ